MTGKCGISSSRLTACGGSWAGGGGDVKENGGGLGQRRSQLTAAWADWQLAAWADMGGVVAFDGAVQRHARSRRWRVVAWQRRTWETWGSHSPRGRAAARSPSTVACGGLAAADPSYGGKK